MIGFVLWVWIWCATASATADPQFDYQINRLGLRLTFREGSAPVMTPYDTDPTLQGRLPDYGRELGDAGGRNRGFGQNAPVGLAVGPGRSRAPAHR